MRAIHCIKVSNYAKKCSFYSSSIVVIFTPILIQFYYALLQIYGLFCNINQKTVYIYLDFKNQFFHEISKTFSLNAQKYQDNWKAYMKSPTNSDH